MNGKVTPAGALLGLAIEELPSVIALLKDRFVKANPTLPAPTSEQVIAAFNAAYYSSLAKDDRWLADHPEKQ